MFVELFLPALMDDRISLGPQSKYSGITASPPVSTAQQNPANDLVDKTLDITVK
jgi:hypothetical protein